MPRPRDPAREIFRSYDARLDNSDGWFYALRTAPAARRRRAPASPAEFARGSGARAGAARGRRGEARRGVRARAGTAPAGGEMSAHVARAHAIAVTLASAPVPRVPRPGARVGSRDPHARASARSLTALASRARDRRGERAADVAPWTARVVVVPNAKRGVAGILGASPAARRRLAAAATNDETHAAPTSPARRAASSRTRPPRGRASARVDALEAPDGVAELSSADDDDDTRLRRPSEPDATPPAPRRSTPPSASSQKTPPSARARARKGTLGGATPASTPHTRTRKGRSKSDPRRGGRGGGAAVERPSRGAANANAPPPPPPLKSRKSLRRARSLRA